MSAEDKLAGILNMLNQHDELERDEVEIKTRDGWVSLRDYIEGDDE